MLKYIDIDSLFGLYSYKLDFSDGDESLKFITGPNGYGKTTLLSMINSFYSGRIDDFFSIPFSSIEFGLDEDKYKITRVRVMEADDLSDGELVQEINQLNICITMYVDKQEMTNEFPVRQGYESDDLGYLQMFLNSIPSYYIKDQRLFLKPAVVYAESEKNLLSPTVLADAKDLEQRLSRSKSIINEAFQAILHLQFSELIEEKKYNERKRNAEKSISRMKRYGLIDENFSVYEYNELTATFLDAYITALEKAISDVSEFLDQLDAFCEIIESYEFADKNIEINPRYGFRFKSHNVQGTLLSPEYLSSGEQHILIMTYELIFRAQDNSVVLIDEPEMSFHLMWQTEFLKTMQRILDVRKNKLQCIVATHSPQIFDNRWDLTLDLYRQVTSEKREEE